MNCPIVEYPANFQFYYRFYKNLPYAVQEPLIVMGPVFQKCLNPLGCQELRTKGKILNV